MVLIADSVSSASIGSHSALTLVPLWAAFLDAMAAAIFFVLKRPQERWALAT